MVGASCSQWIACSPMRNGGLGRPLNSVVSRHASSVNPRIALVFLGIGAVGCVTLPSPLGVWERANQTSFVRVVLNADRSCVFVAGGIIGDKRDGIGFRCSYTQSNDAISITEIGEIDGSGRVEKAIPPINFKYDAGTDSLFTTMDEPIKLSRIRN